MRNMKIKMVNKSNNPMPKYATVGSAGMDIRAHLSEPVTLAFMERKLIPTGLYIEFPHGYDATIHPRSGNALKYGVTVLNSPGVIDEDYRGEIGVIMVNYSPSPFVINNGDRIAQMIIRHNERVEIEQCSNIDEFDDPSTERNGGFGHTGIK